MRPSTRSVSPAAMGQLPDPPSDNASGNRWFAAFLVTLLVLSAALWVADPSHHPAGTSRVHWPESRPVRP